MNLKPINNKVILKKIETLDKTKGGLIIKRSDRETYRAEVIESDCEYIEKGQIVLYAPYAPDEITIDDNDYLIADPDDILAIINDATS